jgi:hypothetical protein
MLQGNTKFSNANEDMLTRSKHFILTIEIVEGEVMLVLTYQREFVKNHWKRKKWQLPIHAFYEIYKEKMPLMFNLILYFLSMASADGVFREFSSVDELLDAVETVAAATGPKERDNELLSTVYFNEELLEVPLLRPYTELLIEDTSGKARGADSFGKEFANLGYRSGYIQNITGRACRRWALMETGKVSNVISAIFC